MKRGYVQTLVIFNNGIQISVRIPLGKNINTSSHTAFILQTFNMPLWSNLLHDLMMYRVAKKEEPSSRVLMVQLESYHFFTHLHRVITNDSNVSEV